jgi:hypothetical protein
VIFLTGVRLESHIARIAWVLGRINAKSEIKKSLATPAQGGEKTILK